MANKGKLITRSGKQLDVIAPEPGDITLADIADGLARQNRFQGLTRHPYTVAQHSVLVAELAAGLLRLARIDENPEDPSAVVRAALLHDATEAYLGDVVSPLKAVLADYMKLEALWNDTILKRFKVDPRLIHTESVQWCDHRAFAVEVNVLIDKPSLYGFESRRDLRKLVSTAFNLAPAYLPYVARPWDPTHAAEEFLACADRLGIKD